MPSGYRERRERRLDEVDRLLLALLLREWDLLLLTRLNSELPWSESDILVWSYVVSFLLVAAAEYCGILLDVRYTTGK
jgi:hypothetical protein